MATVLVMSSLLSPGFEASAKEASSPHASAAALSARAVRSDFALLYQTLQEAHFNLYAHRSKAEYDTHYRSLLATIEAPMDPVAVAILFQKFVAYGRIGHARIDAPVIAFVSQLRGGGKILPIFIRVDGDRVLLTQTADQGGSLRAGAEIVSIDGVPIRQVLERLSGYVSAERPYMAYAQMEESFPVLLWLDRGPLDSLSVTARVGSTMKTVSVKAVTLDQRKALTAKFPGPEQLVEFSDREYKVLEPGIAYLRPGPFFNTEQSNEGPAPSYEASAFRTFIDASFSKLIASGATDLLIDLRNNPGGDNSFSDPMIAWFADRPFRFASSFTLKASAATKADYSRQRVAGVPIDPDFLRQIDAEEKQPNGTRYTYELPIVAPRAEPRFHGRVWLLINRHSYSNAASVAALVQDYGFGKVLGEETADVASNYASVQHFTLPLTGIVVTYPKSHFVRPNGNAEVAGVTPDFPIEPPPVDASGDVALSKALEIIKATADRPI
ncbi:S41 family peptidase [Sphingopyxis sp. JAI128]|uniref:S41 family peptidase n=1 Tax=Sphingopyxis sp. JAI128 TaxID=2723066 RepID=UPI00161EF7D9|nr:S41 family peptidase [Sphingopyxis sp. JAI128]MBB6425720.1 C-terminal processing protease CtpA/Prc [Sphingopyxis sp. JAI128]